MEFRYQVGDRISSVRVERVGDGYVVSIDGRGYDVRASHTRWDELTLVVNGKRHVAYVADSGSTRYVSIDGEVITLTRSDTRRAQRRRHRQGEDSLTASMPGQVTKVWVAEGDVVERGQPLVILEAMKTEIRVSAPRSGRVAKVWVSQGQVVDRGQLLVEIGRAD